MELEGPYEGRLSSKVPGERMGETPLREPIVRYIVNSLASKDCFIGRALLILL